MKMFPDSLTTACKLAVLSFLAPFCLQATLVRQAFASSLPYIADHGINFAAGNMHIQETDISMDGPVPEMAFKRFYNSQATVSGALGQGWSSSFSERLIPGPSTITLVQNDGRHLQFVDDGQGGYASQLGLVQTIIRTSTGFQLTRANQDIHAYDSQGRLTSIADHRGTGLTLTYVNDQVATLTDTLGRTLVFTYTDSRLTSLTTPAGTFTYAFDRNDNLISVTRPDGKNRTYSYGDPSDVHNLTGVDDESNTRIQTVTYDDRDRVVTSSLAGGSNAVAIGYPTAMTRTVTDSLGTVSSYQLEALNGVARVKSLTGPGCTACGSDSGSSYAYTARQQLSSITDAIGVITTFSYDTSGNRLARTDASGTLLARTTTSTYTAKNELATITEASVSNPDQNRVTSMAYDGKGNLLSRTVNGYSGTTTIAATTTFAYNSLGQITSVDGPRTAVKDTFTLAYYPNEEAQGNNRGQLNTVTNPLGQTITYRDYTSIGKPGTIIDANGLINRFTYNLRGQTLSRTIGSLTTTFTYDEAGRLLTATLPGSRILTFTYTGDQVATITDGLGNRISYSYDAKGLRTKEEISDPDNAVTYTFGLAYDAAGNLSKRVYPGTAEETYNYDAVHNLVQSIDPTALQTEYNYDALGRLTAAIESGIGVGTYSYDGQDNLAKVIDARGKTTNFTYDDLGRRRTTAAPDTGMTKATYDKAGNLLTRTDAKKQTVSFAYDERNRPTRQSYPGAARDVLFNYDQPAIGKLTAVQEEESSRNFSYNGLGQLIAETRTLGTATATTHYSYESTSGQLAAMTYPSGRVLSFNRDTAGQITGLQLDGMPLAANIQYLPFGPMQSVNLGNLTVTRSYDQRYQVSRIRAPGLDYIYSRDPSGQVTGVSGVPIPATTGINETATYSPNNNRMTKTSGAGSRNYTYDANGNVTSDGIRTFTWDSLNRLVKVEKAGSIIATYGYDSQNRRIRKTIGTTTIHYHYCQNNLLIGETLADGTPLRDYFYLNGEPIALREYEKSPGLYFYLNDHLGTPQKLVRADGAVVWQAAYLPYGKAQVQLAAVTNKLRFPGQYYDAETGLHYNWHRYYDSATGRYISADPIGLEGGMNLYAYVGGDPVNWIDPLGLASLFTDKPAGTTTFDPRPEDPSGVPFTIQTRNGVDRRALPGAQDAFSTPDVGVRHRAPSKSYGPDGAYIDTGDPRYRNIHGGGSCANNDYGDSQASRQGWCVTLGCTRGQNEDVINLGVQIEDFQRRHPGTPIPYTRN